MPSDGDTERSRPSPPGEPSKPGTPRDGPSAVASSEPSKAASPELSPDRPLEDFLDPPTRELSAWHGLWRRDLRFPIRSHRGFFGRLVVAFKRLFRPLVAVPQNDLWERQRVFNLILLEHLQALAARRLDDRVAHLEGFLDRGVREIMAHNDALFARVDQKMDRHRREVRDLTASLGSALALLEQSGLGQMGSEQTRLDPAPESSVAALSRAREEHGYLELEQRYRGTESEIRERLEPYLPYFEGLREPGAPPVLDLGCGRGEALNLLADYGIPARGIDASERMVERCRTQGLEAETGDLFEVLAAQAEGSLGGILSCHVIEHLPAAELDRLVRLAHRALASGGVLILETPNPLSLVAGARNFWLDPTHRRPVHPESLELLYELAGFTTIERLELRPFPEAERLPEIDLAGLPEDLQVLADRINRLRDRLDDLLFGAQDFAVVGVR